MTDTFMSTVDFIPEQLLLDALAQTIITLYERIGHKDPSAMTEERVLNTFPEFVGIRYLTVGGEVINMQNLRHSYAPALKERVREFVPEYTFMYQIFQTFYPETKPRDLTRFQ